MHRMSATLRKIVYRGTVTLSSAAGALLLALPAYAVPLALSDTPLFLANAVKPNILLAVDDSTSMDYELMLPTSEGIAWWRRDNVAAGTCTTATANSFTGCTSDGSNNVPSAPGVFNDGRRGNPWRKFTVLFPNECDTKDNNTHKRRAPCLGQYAIPPVPAFAWARSPDYNRIYFDPRVTYRPWPDGGGFTFANSPPTAARFDPVFGTASDAVDLTRDLAGHRAVDPSRSCSSLGTISSPSGWSFAFYKGMTLPGGACIQHESPAGSRWNESSTDGNFSTDGSFTAGHRRYNIRYFPATFYLRSAAGLPADYGYTATPLSGKAPDGSAMLGYEIKRRNFATSAQYNAAIQNFANWFTYYRKRHLALRAGLGGAFESFTASRLAGFTINNRQPVTMRDLAVSTDRSHVYKDFYENFVRRGGTPNDKAVKHLIAQFRRSNANAPVEFACQRNAGVLFTDGFTSDNQSDKTVGNVDGDQGAPYADTVSHTMADKVMDAYLRPLRTGTGFAAGQVPVPGACSVSPVNPSLDCNANLHMNFFAVTLGTQGTVFDPDNPVDPYVTTPAWPTSFPSRHPNSVDDIWHATVNGRGRILNASNPNDIQRHFTEVLNIVTKLASSAASAAVNSGRVSSTTRVYQSRFSTTSWTGQLLSFPVNDDGSLGSLEWDAGQQVPAASSRRLITVDSSGNAIPLRWNRLDATRKQELDPSSDGRGEQRLNYLRGDASQEKSSGGTFRSRPSRLGDIVGSSPVFVGAPPFFYPESLESASYAAFRSRQASRTPVIYAGANDGMLHGFNADTGAEILGFVPSTVFDELYRLTDPDYQHRFYVDGPPTMGDVFFGSAWHTVLVGGLHKGGQGIYALDITNPGSFNETNATSVFLWEFDDGDDADLGYTFSQPAIVRMANGKWAAVFGNGYNNTAADGNVSSSGDAVLYVVDIQTGSLIKKISTETGTAEDPTGKGRPNGLATPATVDINRDYIVDYIYAGDLFGNLWKFDVTGSTAASWGVDYSSGGSPQPLFQAKDGNTTSAKAQPITSRPEVGLGPRGRGMIVLFGTGKYLEPDDKDVSKLGTQSFYGIVDLNSGTSSDRVSGRSVLQQQTITDERTATFGSNSTNIRVTSNNAMGAGKLGWYVDLVSPQGFEGEMQVTNSVLRNGRIIFTTLIPDQNRCGFGGTSWLMEMDALSGRRLDETPFDLNLDGEFDEADNVTVKLATGDTVKVPVSARKSEQGIMPTPAILASDEKEYKYAPGSTGEIEVITENPGVSDFGRQSWRQTR